MKNVSPDSSGILAASEPVRGLTRTIEQARVRKGWLVGWLGVVEGEVGEGG